MPRINFFKSVGVECSINPPLNGVLGMAVYGRGSEWRRWDVHVHTPGTVLSDQFGSWDEFVNCIESADSTIVAIGITDYVTLDSYKRFLGYRAQSRMQNIAFVFPNLEFRISPETKDNKGINLHLLVCPDEKDHIDRIEDALSRLCL